MAVILAKTAAVLFGVIAGMCVGLTVSDMLMGRYREEWARRGYDSAVRDIMRYGFYYGDDGEKHEVENIRLWQD